MRAPLQSLSWGGAIAAATVVLLAGCVAGAPPVYAPDADASPTRVALTFVAAINARDADVLEQVSARTYAQSIADGWFGTHIAVLDVQEPYAQTPGTNSAPNGSEVMNVPLLISVAGGDESLPESPFTWSYLVYRASPDDPWKVFDQGQG